MTRRFILNITVILIIGVILAPYAVKATDDQLTDFGLLVLADVADIADVADENKTSEFYVNYYVSMHDTSPKNAILTSSIENDSDISISLKQISKNIAPDWKSWIREHHLTYQKTTDSHNFLVVYTNMLSTWEKLINANIDRKTNIIPLDKLFIALWIDNHSFFNSIGPYFKEQRNWYNSQKKYLENIGSKGSEKLNEINKSIKEATLGFKKWIKYLVFGLIACLASGLIGLIVIAICMLISRRSAQQDDNSELTDRMYKTSEQLPGPSPVPQSETYEQQSYPQPEIPEDQQSETTDEFFQTLTEKIDQQIIPQIECFSDDIKQLQENKYTLLNDSLKDIRSTLDRYFLLGDDNQPGFQTVNKNLKLIMNHLKKSAEKTSSLQRRRYEA